MLFKAEIFLSMMDIGEEPLTIPEKSRKIAYECATCAQINQKKASIAKLQSKKPPCSCLQSGLSFGGFAYAQGRNGGNITIAPKYRCGI
jgi:hypothetical protein